MDFISGLGSLASGVLGFLGAKDANQQKAEQDARNIALQKEFAQSGIQWKVKDAEAAGIHPLYALGASTHSFAPTSVGATSPMSSLADMAKNLGQDLSSSVDNTRTSKQRVTAAASTATALQLKKMGLENELLAAQIAKIRANNTPATPTPNTSFLDVTNDVIVPRADKPEESPVLAAEGRNWRVQPGWVNAEDVEKKYGDLWQEVYGTANLIRDAYGNVVNSQRFKNAVIGARNWAAPINRKKLEARYRRDNWIY